MLSVRSKLCLVRSVLLLGSSLGGHWLLSPSIRSGISYWKAGTKFVVGCAEASKGEARMAEDGG